MPAEKLSQLATEVQKNTHIYYILNRQDKSKLHRELHITLLLSMDVGALGNEGICFMEASLIHDRLIRLFFFVAGMDPKVYKFKELYNYSI